jgi:hypothetical protein
MAVMENTIKLNGKIDSQENVMILPGSLDGNIFIKKYQKKI